MNPTPPNQPSRAAKLAEELTTLIREGGYGLTDIMQGTVAARLQSSLDEERKEAEAIQRNALCRVYEIINASDDFDADEVNAIIKSATGPFPISKEWCMSAATKEELDRLTSQVRDLTEERDRTIVNELASQRQMLEDVATIVRLRQERDAAVIAHTAIVKATSHIYQPTSGNVSKINGVIL